MSTSLRGTGRLAQRLPTPPGPEPVTRSGPRSPVTAEADFAPCQSSVLRRALT